MDPSDHRPAPGPGRIVWTVLVLALVWRAILCLVLVPGWEQVAGIGAFPDRYDDLAATLLERGELGFGSSGATPTTLRGPGFPAWLALGMFLGGVSSAWLGFWTSLPAVAVATVVAALLERRYGRWAALVGGCVIALHPIPGLVSARSMSDEFHAALGLSALVSLAIAGWDASSRRAAGWAVAGAGLLSWHLLTRSSGLLTVAAVAVVAVVVRPRRTRWLVIALALAMLPPLAWSVRSSRLEGRPVFVQSLLGYNFWLGEGFHRFGPESYRGEHYVDRIGLILSHAGLDREPGSFLWTTLTPEESAASEPRLLAAAKRHVGQAPLDYAQRVGAGVVGYWTRANTRARTVHYRLLALPVVLLALWGGVEAVRRRRDGDELALLCLTAVVLHNLAYAAIIAMARNSAQVYPAVGYLTGIGALALVERWRRRRP